MESAIKISVIVPVYNAERYLEICINNILSQDFDGFELVLVNDGSTDGSSRILNKYRGRQNVKIIEQENKGVSAARNAGLLESSGKYIMFVDADDTIEKTMLKKMYEVAEQSSLDLVISDIEDYHAKKNVGNGSLLDFLIYNELWSPCAKLVKRSTIIFGFDTNIAIAEDLLFCYQNSINWKSYEYIPKKMYHYRNNVSSAMRKNRVRRKDLTVFDVLDRIISDKDLDEGLRAFLKSYYVKTYYYIFSKEVRDKDIVLRKRKLAKTVSEYYKDVKEHGLVSKKMFVQAKLTPIYNILRKSALNKIGKRQK